MPVYLQDLKSIPTLNNVERFALLKINAGQKNHVSPRVRAKLKESGLINNEERLTFRGTAALKAALRREAKDGN